MSQAMIVDTSKTPKRGLQVIGIGEIIIGRCQCEDDAFITYGLGSCLGVAIYDPLTRVGGMLHAQLPSSKKAADLSRAKAGTYVDLGVPRLFKACYDLGAVKERLTVKIAGGAQFRAEGEDSFKIGKRNLTQLRKLLWKNGVLVNAEDCGGTEARAMRLSLKTGETAITDSRGTRTL